MKAKTAASVAASFTCSAMATSTNERSRRLSGRKVSELFTHRRIQIDLELIMHWNKAILSFGTSFA